MDRWVREDRRESPTLQIRLSSGWARRRDVAHRDIAGFRHQLADEFAAHAAAAAGDYRGPPSEFGMCTSLAFRSRCGPSPLSADGEARRGSMSGRQAPANLARELLEEIDIVRQPLKLDFDTYYNAVRPKAGNQTWLL